MTSFNQIINDPFTYQKELKEIHDKALEIKSKLRKMNQNKEWEELKVLYNETYLDLFNKVYNPLVKIRAPVIHRSIREEDLIDILNEMDDWYCCPKREDFSNLSHPVDYSEFIAKIYPKSIPTYELYTNETVSFSPVTPEFNLCMPYGSYWWFNGTLKVKESMPKMQSPDMYPKRY